MQDSMFAQNFSSAKEGVLEALSLNHCYSGTGCHADAEADG
jgi:hypothetical protein